MSRRSTDILLVGKTGNGKSATANSIVRYRSFMSKNSSISVTKSAQFEYGEFEGKNLKVVDGPGVGDTSLDSEEAIKLVVDAMSFAIAANPAGYHAILLVVRCGSRFTKEDVDAIRVLKGIFGDDFITCHAILIMTCGDTFPSDEEDGTFEEWIQHQEGCCKELMIECGNRVLLFDNRTKDKNIQNEQLRKLLKMIDHLAGNGQRYTSSIFHKAKDNRDSLIKKSKKPQLSEETLMECGLINQKLCTVDNKHPEEAVVLLEKLRTRAEVLEQDIKKQDQGTNCLHAAIFLAEQLKESISEHMKAINEILKRKHQLDQKELELDMKLCRMNSEEKRKREDECKRLERIEEERVDYQNLLKQKEEEMQKKMEIVRKNYETVKEEESWTWGSVASAIAAPVVSFFSSWFS